MNSKFNYKNKYLKYKIKYLNLISLYGGGIQSAKKMFFSRIKNSSKYQNTYDIFNNDRYLKSIIICGKSIPTVSEVSEFIKNESIEDNLIFKKNI